MKPIEETGTMTARAVMPGTTMTSRKPSSCAMFAGVAERWAPCMSPFRIANSAPLTTSAELSLSSQVMSAASASYCASVGAATILTPVEAVVPSSAVLSAFCIAIERPVATRIENSCLMRGAFTPASMFVPRMS